MLTQEEMPEGWIAISGEDARRFEDELKKEASSTHALFGLMAQCLARRADRDDFLFFLPEHSHPLAVVHLTWSKETKPDFPWTTFFESAADFSVSWRRIFE
jgi:hypothetical protein